MSLWWWVGVILWSAFVALTAWFAGWSAGYGDAMSPENLELRMRQSEEAEDWTTEDLERSKQANALAREYLKDGSPGTHPQSQ